MSIRENIKRLLAELPPGVRLMAAIKGRQPDEVLAAVEAGVSLLGENYVQEAERVCPLVDTRAEWHLIGHLQRNKVKKAVSIFDMIETVDSLEIAREIDRRAGQAGKVMPVLIEVNSGYEKAKSGVLPETAGLLARELAGLVHIKLMGLMTVGPLTGRPEDSRPYFRNTRELLHAIGAMGLPGVEMKYLSMGMSDSYRVAVEEGANIIRIGTSIFGYRP
ncbi:MAG: YggS family pyridoxal phosphate-dependent enzyme [Chloroflexi bacterium]|nr:YggS family pyridoxal phosphate-dependent enzyme [Chloroflexota bacterium]